MKKIRNSAKAIIIHKGRLLVIHKQDDQGDYFILPGGGQHYGEPLPNAVRREVREETRLDIQVGELIFIRDYVSSNHEFANLEQDAHQVEFMFMCEINGRVQAGMGAQPDNDQIGINWLPLENLMDYRLYPLALRPQLLEKIHHGTGPIYLGDIN